MLADDYLFVIGAGSAAECAAGPAGRAAAAVIIYRD
jgi:hypothetical protein